MSKHYKDLLDKVDNLMIALCKQKNLIGLEPGIVKALKDITKSRNAYKKQFNESVPAAIVIELPSELLKRKKQKVINYQVFLDEVSKRVNQ